MILTQKYIAMLYLGLVCILLASCANENITASTNQKESVVEYNVLEGSTSAENCVSEDILQDIRNSIGFPFRLHHGSADELIVFYIENSDARREHHVSGGYAKDDPVYYQDNLQWAIYDYTLQISGKWTESFTIDPYTFTATSEKDGKVYWIGK